MASLQAKAREADQASYDRHLQNEKGRCFSQDLNSLGDEVVSTGKHEGRTVKEVFADPWYVTWLMQHQESNVKFQSLMIYNQRREKQDLAEKTETLSAVQPNKCAAPKTDQNMGAGSSVPQTETTSAATNVKVEVIMETLQHINF